MPSPDRFAFDDFVLDPSQQRLLRQGGSEVRLTPRLFAALLLFVEHAGQLLDKDRLMQALWPGLVVEENNLSQVVSALRRALGDDSRGSRFIQTVPRRGFRFVGAVTRLPGSGAVAAGDTLSPPVDGGPVSVPPPTPAGADAPSPRRRGFLGAGLSVGVAAVLAGAGWWRWGRPPEADVEAPALAVLPFRLQGADGGHGLLAVGMADGVIARLSAVPPFVVRPTGAVKRYAGAEQNPLRAARELGVSWIVDGSLEQTDGRLRVSARLLRAADGRTFWNASFDEPPAGIFDIQDRIASRVTQVLAPAVGGDARAAELAPLADAGGTHSAAAYELFLAASRRAESGRDDGLKEAIVLFRRALDIDPRYANAWVGMAWAERRRVWNADAMPAEAFGLSSAALKRALDIVPDLVQARQAAAATMYFFGYDWAGAERELRAVLASHPNTANAHWDLALLLLTQGRVDAGLAHMRRARECDPTSPIVNTIEASLLVDRGLLAEARTRLDRAFDFGPNLWLAHVAQGELLIAERQAERGIAALRRAVELADATTRPKAVLARHLALVGQTGEARAILDVLRTRAATRFVPPTSPAMIHAALGETGPALDALERALQVRDTRLVYLKDDPSWMPLRKEPRFAALLKRLGLDTYGPGLAPV